MKKHATRFLPLIFVAAALLLSGCGKSSSSGTVDTINHYQGTEGVTAQFLPESAPRIITAGGSAEALLLVSNRGAADASLSEVLVAVYDTTGVMKFTKPAFRLDEQGVIVNQDPGNLGKLPG